MNIYIGAHNITEARLNPTKETKITVPMSNFIQVSDVFVKNI